MKNRIEEFENTINVNEIKIIIADDGIQICKQIVEELKYYKRIEILGVANTDEEERNLIDKLQPDIVVTDLIRNNKFTGLDIIKEYNEKEKGPKFIIVSYIGNCKLYNKFKNIDSYLYKYPKINYSELAYKIICAKRTIWKEHQELIENKILKCSKKNSFCYKIKTLMMGNILK